MSFVWGNDVNPGTAFGEDGNGSGLVVSFDIYDNGGGEAPAIDVIYAGTVIASTKMPISQIETGTGYVDVVVRVEPDGTLDLYYNNKVIYSNLLLTGYSPIEGGSFGFGARTGGLNEEQYVDDIRISTSTSTTGGGPRLTITRNATGVITISWTGGGILQARDSLDTNAPWTPVPGATNPYTVQNDRRMRFFRVQAP